jgi:hypothetical protein
MAKKGPSGKTSVKKSVAASAPTREGRVVVSMANRPSALLGTRVVYCGDNLEQLAKLPDGCVDLIYIEHMRPRCVPPACGLRKTGSFHCHYDWHALHATRE